MELRQRRKKNHDFKSHIGCIRELLGSGEYDKAKAYVAEIGIGYVDEMNYVNTNHTIVNAIINQKYKLAKEKGITMILSLNDLSNIIIKDEDIVTILANLLDNAIEACDKITTGNKIIKFKFVLENDEIYISVRNPMIGALEVVNGYPVSTKENPTKHGIGLKNVEATVTKYNGECNYSANEGYFTYTIIMGRTIK